MILSFVALRKPPENAAAPSFAASSDFQLQLAEAAAGQDPSETTVAVAKAFVEDQRFGMSDSRSITNQAAGIERDLPRTDIVS